MLTDRQIRDRITKEYSYNSKLALASAISDVRYDKFKRSLSRYWNIRNPINNGAYHGSS